MAPRTSTLTGYDWPGRGAARIIRRPMDTSTLLAPSPLEGARHSRLLAAFALLALLVRLPAFVFPALSDLEARDAVVAATTAAGERLYVDVPAVEPPFGYWLSNAVDAVFGPLSGRMHHLMGLLAVLAAMGILAFAARALAGDRGRPMAALFLGVFSVAQSPAALGATPELWALALACAGVWLALGAAPQGRYGLLFGAGALASSAMMFRVEAGAALLAIVAYIGVWRPLLLGRARFAMALLGVLVFLLGAALPAGVLLGYLHQHDALAALAANLWSDGSAQVRIVLANVGLFAVGSSFLWFFALRELWRTARGLRLEAAGEVALEGSDQEESAALAALAGRPLRGEDDAAVALVGSWLVLALVAVSLRARCGGTDFVALVAPLALLAARGTASIADDFWTGRAAITFRLGIALPVALFFGAALFHDGLYRALGAPTPSALVVTKAVRAVGGDDLGVLGGFERAYVFARRVPPRGFAAATLGPRATGARPPALPSVLVDVSQAPVPSWVVEGYDPVSPPAPGVRLFARRAQAR